MEIIVVSSPLTSTGDDGDLHVGVRSHLFRCTDNVAVQISTRLSDVELSQHVEFEVFSVSLRQDVRRHAFTLHNARHPRFVNAAALDSIAVQLPERRRRRVGGLCTGILGLSKSCHARLMILMIEGPSDVRGLLWRRGSTMQPNRKTISHWTMDSVCHTSGRVVTFGMHRMQLGAPMSADCPKQHAVLTQQEISVR